MTQPHHGGPAFTQRRMTALPSTEDLARLAALSAKLRSQDPIPSRSEIAAEIDAIREVLDRREADGWRDISTAPKDGTPILTYSDACVETEAQMVMWWSNDKAERCGFGWEAYDVSHMLAPSYWRPLPSTPTTEE